MPNMFGGDQLDPDYAPWAEERPSKRERAFKAAWRSLRREESKLDRQIDVLERQRKALDKKFATLQKRCPHSWRDVNMPYGILGRECRLCGDRKLL